MNHSLLHAFVRNYWLPTAMLLGIHIGCGSRSGLLTNKGSSTDAYPIGGASAVIGSGQPGRSGMGGAVFVKTGSARVGATVAVGTTGGIRCCTGNPLALQQEAYVKPSRVRAYDEFGASLALSNNTLVVGTVTRSVFVFVRRENGWSEQAEITDLDWDGGDIMTSSVALSGNTLALAAEHGAVYVYVRRENTWVRQARLAPEYPGERMGNTVALDGDTLACSRSGDGVYIFVREGSSWIQKTFAKASDGFGKGIAVSGDIVAVSGAGGIYIYARSGDRWPEQDRLSLDSGNKPSSALALSDDTIAFGASDSSAARGVNGSSDSGSLPDSGAVHVFTRNGNSWSRQAFIKNADPVQYQYFGEKVALAGDALVVGVPGDSGDSAGVNGEPTANPLDFSGAMFVYERRGSDWIQRAYVKASNPGYHYFFGSSVAISGNTIAVGSRQEDGATPGINGDQADATAERAGAVYIFTGRLI